SPDHAKVGQSLARSSESSMRRDVRFGSKADIGRGQPDVRFTPKSRHRYGDRHVRFVPKADIQTTVGYYCRCAHLAECRTRIPFVRPPGLSDFDMDLPRRTFLHLAAGVAGLATATREQCSRRHCPPGCAIARRAAWPI